MLKYLAASLLCLQAFALHAADELVIYSGRGEKLVAPLFTMFEANSGIKVDVRYNKTPALASQIANEAAQCPADVFFAQDSGYIAALAKAGLLTPHDKNLHQNLHAPFVDEAALTLGISARARVLVYNPKLIDEKSLPQSLKDLSKPIYKDKLGWAPSNASLQAHISLLRAQWGEEETEAWLKAVMANNPRVYPKNSPQVKAADAGELAIGWVNHYYLHRLMHDEMQAKNYSFTHKGDLGNVIMISSAALLKHGKNTDAAQKFLNFLVSSEAQAFLAQTGFEYPAHKAIATHKDVPPIDTLNLADIQQRDLTDIAETLKLLQKLGLQ